MFPPLTMQHAPYSSLMNSKLSSQLSAGDSAKMFVSYPSHLGVTELRVVVVIPPRHPSLLRRIRHVVFLGAQKKVLGIAARSVVALVKNFDRWWDFAFRNRPRNAVSSPRLAPKLSFAVACLEQCASPRPAFVWLSKLHARKESFSKWRRFLPFGNCTEKSNSFCVARHEIP
jgi:hypothetical protein